MFFVASSVSVALLSFFTCMFIVLYFVPLFGSGIISLPVLTFPQFSSTIPLKSNLFTAFVKLQWISVIVIPMPIPYILYLYFLLIFQSFFCPERRTGEKFGLPSSLSVLSENPEIMGSLLSLTVRYLGYIIVNMHWIRIKLCLGRDRLFKVRTSADLQPTGIYIYIYIM